MLTSFILYSGICFYLSYVYTLQTTFYSRQISHFPLLLRLSLCCYINNNFALISCVLLQNSSDQTLAMDSLSSC